jgi:hypothetical protein
MSDKPSSTEDTDLGDDVECALCLAATQAAIASTSPGRLPPETLQDELAFLRAAVDYYQAGLLKRMPLWVPCLVRLHADVRGDFPIGHRSVVAAGVHQAFSNAWGAISVVAADGQRLGIKPAEFEPLRFTRNPAAGFQPSPETQARCAEKAST